MRKAILLMLSLMLCIFITACVGGGEDTSTVGENTTQESGNSEEAFSVEDVMVLKSEATEEQMLQIVAKLAMRNEKADDKYEHMYKYYLYYPVNTEEGGQYQLFEAALPGKADEIATDIKYHGINTLEYEKDGINIVISIASMDASSMNEPSSEHVSTYGSVEEAKKAAMLAQILYEIEQDEASEDVNLDHVMVNYDAEDGMAMWMEHPGKAEEEQFYCRVQILNTDAAGQSQILMVFLEGPGQANENARDELMNELLESLGFSGYLE